MALQLWPITEVELIHIQAVVTTTTVERLDAPVPHLTRPNAAYKRLTRGTLAALRNALRLVVAPQHLRWVPQGANDVSQLRRDPQRKWISRPR